MAITNNFIQKWIKKVPNIESSLEENTSYMKSITIQPSLFKLPTDVDDTESIKKAISYAISNGYRKITFPYQQEYEIKKPIWLNGISDFFIDGNNSLIKWNGNEVVSSDRATDVGVFAIHGKRTYTQTNILEWNKKILLKTNIDGLKGHTCLCSKLTVSNTSGFSKNDFVRFLIGNPNDSGNNDYTNVFKPTVDYCVKILDIIGNDIYIDYWSPYDFSQVDITKGTITKLDMIENIDIGNFRIKDITPYGVDPSVTTDNPNRDKLVCGIGVRYGHNINIHDINCEDMNLPAIVECWSHTCFNRHINNKNPRSHGGGEGYGIQGLRSIHLYTEDLFSNNGNSVLDYSACSFCHAKRVKGTNTYSHKMLGTHGMAEHNIVFEDCEGVFSFNNSTGNFCGMSMNVSLIRCSGEVASAVDGYLTGVFTDCDFYFRNSIPYYFADVNLNNCKLKFGSLSAIFGHVRGINDKRRLKLNNCDIYNLDGSVENASISTKFKGFDLLEISKGEIDLSKVSGTFALEDIKYCDIDTKITDTGIEIINNTIDKSVYNIKSTFEVTKLLGSGFFIINTIKNNNLLFNMNGVNITYTGDTEIPLFKYTRDASAWTNKLNSNIVINVKGGMFYSKTNEKLLVNIPNMKDTSKNSMVIGYANGNTLVNCKSSGTLETTTNNSLTLS